MSTTTSQTDLLAFVERLRRLRPEAYPGRPEALAGMLRKAVAGRHLELSRYAFSGGRVELYARYCRTVLHRPAVIHRTGKGSYTRTGLDQIEVVGLSGDLHALSPAGHDALFAIVCSAAARDGDGARRLSCGAAHFNVEVGPAEAKLLVAMINDVIEEHLELTTEGDEA